MSRVNFSMPEYEAGEAGSYTPRYDNNGGLD
jgi:hypothetical protein